MSDVVTVRFLRSEGQEHPELLLLALRGICQSINEADFDTESSDLERVEQLAIAAAALSAELTRRLAA